MENNNFPQENWLASFRASLKNRTLKPFFVQWMATDQCNFSCAHCGTGAGGKSKDELTTAQVYSALDSLGKLGCEYFSITGGEAFLRPDIFDILAYARKKNIRVSVVTNGFATKDYLPRLKKARLHGVSVSIDGYRKKHDLLRNKEGSYARCLESLKIYKKLAVPLRQVATVVLKENIRDIPKMIADAYAAGCTRYRLQLVIPEGRAKGRTTSLVVIKKAMRIVWSERKKGRNVFCADTFGFLGPWENKLRPHYFFCGCGWWTLTIMQNGDIMGCPAVDHPRLKEGSIKEDKLEDIWWKKFGRFRNLRPDGLPVKCRDCKYLTSCRGGCWALRVNAEDFCFVELAESAEFL